MAFHKLRLHRNQVSLASGILSLIAFRKAVEVMSSYVLCDKRIELIDYLKFLLFFHEYGLLTFKDFLGYEEIQWRDVVVDSCACIFSHVEAFAKSFDCIYSNVIGKLSV